MRMLAISGSLRARSSHTALLRAAAEQAPEVAEVSICLKNVLNWVVSSGELYGKPVALVSASPRSTHARASLIETLTVMMARVVPEASITLPLCSHELDQAGVLSHPEIAGAMSASVLAFASAIDSGRDQTSV